MKKVIAVNANEDFSLDLRFNDGGVRRFDVKPYLDVGVFRELRVMVKVVWVIFGCQCGWKAGQCLFLII